MPKGKRLSPEQIKDIIDSYVEKRASRSEIALSYDIAPTTVNRIVRENGWHSHRTESNHTVNVKTLGANDPTVVEAFAPIRTRRTRSLAVTIDSQEMVQQVAPIRQSKSADFGNWEVKFTGSVIVEAESIDQAISEARKLGIVRRIYSVHMKGR